MAARARAPIEYWPVSLAGDLARQRQRRVNGSEATGDSRRPARKYTSPDGLRMDRVVAGVRRSPRPAGLWSRGFPGDDRARDMPSCFYFFSIGRRAGRLDTDEYITTTRSLRFLLCTCSVPLPSIIYIYIYIYINRELLYWCNFENCWRKHIFTLWHRYINRQCK
jgi:hypothetical protein